ncbi:MAG: hypothetical protein J3R72DRAFT_438803 [Linnemannia gamsii]|nr:MAG: hypothetical protein J3R72DRAFT_438803 [Linnemannia gamsii]
MGLLFVFAVRVHIALLPSVVLVLSFTPVLRCLGRSSFPPHSILSLSSFECMSCYAGTPLALEDSTHEYTSTKGKGDSFGKAVDGSNKPTLMVILFMSPFFQWRFHLENYRMAVHDENLISTLNSLSPFIVGYPGHTHVFADSVVLCPVKLIFLPSLHHCHCRLLTDAPFFPFRSPSLKKGLLADR